MRCSMEWRQREKEKTKRDEITQKRQMSTRTDHFVRLCFGELEQSPFLMWNLCKTIRLSLVICQTRLSFVANDANRIQVEDENDRFFSREEYKGRKEKR
jgi:hypothetical protein